MVPASGTTLAQNRSQVGTVSHKLLPVQVDDDGSTSAGSSDRESDSPRRKPACKSEAEGQNGAAALVYLMSVLSCAQEPADHTQAQSPMAMRKAQRGQRQQTNVKMSLPPGFDALSLPPGLEAVNLPKGFSPPPGLSLPPAPPPGLGHQLAEAVVLPFNPKLFHRELVAVFRELSQSSNVAAAVRRVRAQKVPQSHQANETTDILTRASEECRGTHRRLFFAFAAGLAKGNTFESCEVLLGIESFFRDVYQDLCEEVPRLPSIVEAELVPTLREVFPADMLDRSLPARFRVA